MTLNELIKYCKDNNINFDSTIILEIFQTMKKIESVRVNKENMLILSDEKKLAN